MFETITDFALIEKYQKELSNQISTHLNRETYNEIGFQGDAIYAKVNSNEKADIWCSMSEYLMSGSRYWNAFGRGTPKENAHITPIVEINIPNGLNRSVGGVFLYDDYKNVYLGHRGKIGGGKNGIGKSKFFEKYKGHIIEARDNDFDSNKNQYSEIAIISPLYDENLIANLKKFIIAVQEIKQNLEITFLPSFDPENELRSSYEINGTINPVVEHAAIVNALRNQLLEKGHITYNTKEIDLFSLNSKGEYDMVFEVIVNDINICD